MYMLNNKGLKTDPCGTLKRRCINSLKDELVFVLYFLLLRKVEMKNKSRKFEMENKRHSYQMLHLQMIQLKFNKKKHGRSHLDMLLDVGVPTNL